MDRAGDTLLSRATLAKEEHASPRLRCTLDLLVHALHCGPGSHHPIPVEHFGEGARSPPLGLVSIERLADDPERNLSICRLLDEVDGAQLRGLHRRRYRALPADDHYEEEDDERQAPADHLSENLDPGESWQLEVQEEEVHDLLVQKLQRRATISGLDDQVAVVLQPLADAPAHEGIVIDDEDAGRRVEVSPRHPG